MKKNPIYFLALDLFAVACKTVYNTNKDTPENGITVDVRLVAGSVNNTIEITKTMGFNEKCSFREKHPVEFSVPAKKSFWIQVTLVLTGFILFGNMETPNRILNGRNQTDFTS